MPNILKGILREDDARTAVEHGVEGIIVSNHGGRQLDTTPTSIEMLPQIAEAVGDKLEILIDGGIRRGTDILKALALGAKAVLIGRPIIWGLSAQGSTGVYNILQSLQYELKSAMTFCGCKKLKDITSDLVVNNFN
jgi:4-hydroxymandelate oxidase